MPVHELISVIVTVHNMEHYLRKCMDSILAQDYPSIEIIVVDDESTDQSAALLDGYAAKHANIHVIHQDNSGISQARNVGIACAKGKYISQIDADDWVEPTYLSSLYRVCKKYDVLCAACNHTIEHGSSLKYRFPLSTKEKVLQTSELYHNILYHKAPDVSAWGKLYDRSVFEQIKYPQGLLYEDTYLIVDVIKKVGSIAFTPEPLYHYLIRNNSISRGEFRPSKLDFIKAVNHMTGTILDNDATMRLGCIRRQTHAALSVRRYFVNCSPELLDKRNELERIIRHNAKSVLLDKYAPKRDKAAILAVFCGSGVYDFIWEKMKANGNGGT